MKSATLYYFYDPMCSWCWGFKPTWVALCKQLPETIAVKYVAGGLAPDNDEPMPEEMQLKLQMTWQQINRQLGAEFNFDFWRDCKPRRSTWLSCRAAIAASLQGKLEEMITAIQKGYYLRAMNPSDLEVLETFAQEIGLDVARFSEDIAGDEVAALFNQQLNLTSKMPIRGFPSLVIEVDGQVEPIALNYQDAKAMYEQITEITAD